MENPVPAVVTVDWLKQQLDSVNDNIRILEVTWYSAKDGQEQYKQKHIKTAAYFSPFHNTLHTDLYPRNLPDELEFEQFAQSLGINNDTHVVVYDQEGQNGFFAGGRAWWTFKLYGLEKVSVLNGGLQKWEAMGFPVTTEVPVFKKGNFKTKYNSQWRRTFEEAKCALQNHSLFADSRAPEKYKSGHIQGAVNVPFRSLFENGLLKDPEKLKNVFSESGIDLSKPVITNCTSGMSSTSLALAAHVAGAESVSVFHGGITEWKSKAGEDSLQK